MSKIIECEAVQGIDLDSSWFKIADFSFDCPFDLKVIAVYKYSLTKFTVGGVKVYKNVGYEILSVLFEGVSTVYSVKEIYYKTAKPFVGLA